MTTTIADVVSTEGMGEIAQTLGIELPAKIASYQQLEKEEVYEVFSNEIDRLLVGAKTPVQRKLTGDGLALIVGSSLDLRKIPGEDGDPYGEGGGWGRADTTKGPNRWMKITAPLQLSGVGVKEEFVTGVQLQASEEYSGLVSTRPEDPEEIRINLSIKTLGTPVVASPGELMFGLEPSRAFVETSPSSEEHGEKWRNYQHEEGGNRMSNSLSFDQQNRVFGVGIEVLKRIKPDMLTP